MLRNLSQRGIETNLESLEKKSEEVGKDGKKVDDVEGRLHNYVFVSFLSDKEAFTIIFKMR